MRIIETLDVIHAGELPLTATWKRATSDVEAAIKATDWPWGSGSFSLNPEPGEDKQGRTDFVLPMRATQRYLTDRVGNFEEIAPYFEFWSRYPVPDGALRIYGVGYDQLDPSVPHIPKGKDGRALG